MKRGNFTIPVRQTSTSVEALRTPEIPTDKDVRRTDDRGHETTSKRTYAAVLASLEFAFSLRVLGQAVVAVNPVRFLPPMEEWYSGLLPYPVLLPIQVAILSVQTTIACNLWRGAGWLATPRPRLGVQLRRAAGLYFTLMLLRYGLTMACFPERRWFTGTIPIVFHWVLAAYLFVLGRFHGEPAQFAGAVPNQ